MKRTALALIFAAVFLGGLSLNSFPVVRFVEANPYSGADNTLWRIKSPQNHTRYNPSMLAFSFDCETNDLWDEYDDGLNLEYCIDGSDYWKEWDDGSIVHVMPEEDRISIKANLISNPNESRKTFQYNTKLHNLTDGQHKLSIYRYYKPWGPDEPFTNTEYLGIFFYVDTAAPKITNLSVNGTSGNKLLSFNVDVETSWVGYSLDNQANVTVDDNTVLRGLSSGSHYVTVYAEDTAGNRGASETLYFTVEEYVPEPSPIPLVLASTGAVSAVGVGLLVYFKKRKH